MAGFIELAGICKSFITSGARREVLQGIDLSVERGEFVSIVGSMGSGKSTLLNIAAGLLAPDHGSVRLGDGRPAGSRPSAVEGPGPSGGKAPNAALVFQNYSLLPWFTALENVRLAVQAAFPKRSRADHLRAGAPEPRAGRARRRARSPARPAVGRHAPAGRDRAGVRD